MKHGNWCRLDKDTKPPKIGYFFKSKNVFCNILKSKTYSSSSSATNLAHLIKIAITWPIFELGHPDFAW